MKVIAILGSGIAGDRAAFAARQTDPEARVVMVTREPYPLYSACVLADYAGGRIPKSDVFLRTIEDYSREGIDLLLARNVVRWSSEQRILSFDDEKLSYDRLVLATGSRPVIPPIPGLRKEGVCSLKTILDADLLRSASGRRLVVVGSGPVGIELAVAFRAMGWSVTLIELLDRLLPGLLDFPLAESVKKMLEAKGNHVLVEERVLEVLGGKLVEEIRTDQRRIPADIVALVAGMRPEVELAKEGGVQIGPKGGVLTSEHMGTSLDDVWACGDCAESRDLLTGLNGTYMRWNNARIQGWIAGANAAGGKLRYSGSLNVATVKIFDQAVSSLGMRALEFSEREVQVLHRKGSPEELWLVFKDNRLVGAQALGQTERLGGLIGVILRCRDLLKIGPGGAGPWTGHELWPLYGMEQDILRLLGTTL
jgi:NADH oxidase (H2O2-forming)